MSRTYATSPSAIAANQLVKALQARFVDRLTELAGSEAGFAPISWLRDGGRHGGGTRLATGDTAVFDRASVNVSQVHYDDLPDKRLASATALSTIVHPADPRCPSVHVHLSWTEFKDGSGGWRWMADLNPSNPHPADRERFLGALERGSPPELLADALARGDAYFRIPALNRHRGVAHYYVENHRSGEFAADLAAARQFGEVVLDGYAQILAGALARAAEREPTAEECSAQLAYHTVYFFQVLTLDRGTTSGLLVHDQNDVGVMGSLPSHVDRELLADWAARVPKPQDRLVAGLLDALPPGNPAPVSDPVKARLAAVSRAHYRAHPEALGLQAVTPGSPAVGHQ